MGDSLIHFISGLPRSGSTLLAALLRQNPRFHAEMSSALAPLVNANLSIMSAGSEISELLDARQRARILRAIFQEYRSMSSEREVFIDTSRSWCARMPLVSDLFSGAVRGATKIKTVQGV
ncbi:sulfotransferase [Kordiimonas sp.]|uniref:sulfotransferase n=1 Tax=Kordiimonas sp. TaxID=1970157 RepID=UPI003A8EBB89